jgi:protein-tyrosine phosphatase
VNPEPAQNAVTNDLIIGRRLLSREVDSEFANYVDLTAEFSEPHAIRHLSGYLCFPILDGSALEIGALRETIQRLRPGKTFIHCAQGHGRTGLFALALMLHTGVVRTVNEGLEKLKAVRRRVGLSTVQQKCIEEFAEVCRENET